MYQEPWVELPFLSQTDILSHLSVWPADKQFGHELGGS